MPRGIVHTIGLCERFVGGDKFVVYLGDNLLRGGIRDFNEFDESDLEVMIILCEVEPQRFGVAEFDGKGKLKRLISVLVV